MSPSYPTPDALWQAALAELRLRMTQATYDVWLSGSQALLPASGDEQLVVAVPSPYAPAWLTQRLGDLIHATLTDLTGRSLPIVFVPTGSVETKGQSPAILSIPSTPTPLQGATIMTNQSQTQAQPPTSPAAAGSTRVRIYSYLTKSRFLHIEDSLQIGKVRLFGGTYRRNEGMSDHGHHFLDIADTRVIFTVLMSGEANFSHKEYKGTAPVKDRAAVSRVLSVTAKGENVYIELKSGPGKLTETGAIMPAGQPKTAINIGFKRYEARRMAASVLAYLRAWDVLRMMAHKQMVSELPSYLLVSTTSEVDNDANGMDGANGNGPRPSANGTAVFPPPAANSNEMDVTRRDLATGPKAKTNGLAVPAALLYGDGTAVDAGNQTEAQTYNAYLAEKQSPPQSKEALLAYYRAAAG
jgi:hypothetical protein